MPKYIIPSSDEQNVDLAYAGQNFDIEETEVEDGTTVLSGTTETGTMVLFDEDEEQNPTPVSSTNRAVIPEPTEPYPYTESTDNYRSRVVEDLNQVNPDVQPSISQPDIRNDTTPPQQPNSTPQPQQPNSTTQPPTHPDALDKDFGFDIDEEDFDITAEATTVLDFEDGTDELQPYTPPVKPKGDTQKLVEHETQHPLGYVPPTFNNTSGQGMFTEEEKRQLEMEREKKRKEQEQKQASLNSSVALALARKLKRDPSEFKQNIYDDSATAALYYSNSDSNESTEVDFMNQVRNSNPRQEIPAETPSPEPLKEPSIQPKRFNTPHNFSPEDLEADADMGLTKKKGKKPKKLNSGISLPMILFLIVAGLIAVYVLFFT